MKDVTTATVEVMSDGKKIIDVFPYSLSAPASIVFDVAKLKHGASRRAYLETIYQCVSKGSQEKMLNEDGTFCRGSKQMFTVEHIWWMHIIHEALHSRQSHLIEEGKQNSHTLIRQKVYYDKWKWQDFARTLDFKKETLRRFYGSTSKIIYKAQEIYEELQQSRQPFGDSTTPRDTSQSKRRKRRSPSRGSNFDLGNISNYF